MREQKEYGNRDRESFGGFGGFSGPRGPSQSTAPVKVGDELTVTIDAVGVKGDGIAKKDGFVLFVPNAKQGQQIKIRVTKVLRKVGFAEIVGGSESAPAEQSQAPAAEPAAEEAPAEEPAAEDSEDFGEEKQ